MGYTKANEILPIEIVEQIQNYIDGKIIYIPKCDKSKKPWGENTDTKKYLSTRNAEIYDSYQNGITIRQLSEKYYLVEKSIQRIIRQEKNSKL